MIRVITCILLLNFTLQFGGYQAYFSIVQKKIREKSHIAIHDKENQKEFINLSFHVNKTLDWKEENEFRYEGNMYDVVSKSIKNDTLYLTCYHDKEETEVWANFDSVSEIVFNKTLQNVKKILETMASFSAPTSTNIFSEKNQFQLLSAVKTLNFTQIFYANNFHFSVFQPPENHKNM